MKKIFLSFLCFGLGVSMLLAQKTVNDANASKRTVASFHGIHVGTGIHLMLSEGSTEEVAVSAATEEFRDKIVTKVENGILKIYYEDKLQSINKRKEKKDLKAYVSFKSLDELEANTGAQVDVDGVIKSTKLKINANTGAEVTAKVKVSELKVDQNTGSKITLSGEATNLDIEGDTGSKFAGTDLSTDICDANVSTGAGITITANKELNAKANTGGIVKYKGAATVKDIKKNTGGTITKI